MWVGCAYISGEMEIAGVKFDLPSELNILVALRHLVFYFLLFITLVAAGSSTFIFPTPHVFVFWSAHVLYFVLDFRWATGAEGSHVATRTAVKVIHPISCIGSVLLFVVWVVSCAQGGNQWSVGAAIFYVCPFAASVIDMFISHDPLMDVIGLFRPIRELAAPTTNEDAQRTRRPPTPEIPIEPTLWNHPATPHCVFVVYAVVAAPLLFGLVCAASPLGTAYGIKNGGLAAGLGILFSFITTLVWVLALREGPFPHRPNASGGYLRQQLSEEGRSVSSADRKGVRRAGNGGNGGNAGGVAGEVKGDTNEETGGAGVGGDVSDDNSARRSTRALLSERQASGAALEPVTEAAVADVDDESRPSHQKTMATLPARKPTDKGKGLGVDDEEGDATETGGMSGAPKGVNGADTSGDDVTAKDPEVTKTYGKDGGGGGATSKSGVVITMGTGATSKRVRVQISHTANIRLCVLHPIHLGGTYYDIGAKGASIGSLPANSITFNEDAVSRRHARITYSEATDTFSITDLGSLNGTTVTTEEGSDALTGGEPHELAIGHIISIGGAACQLAVIGNSDSTDPSKIMRTNTALANYVRQLRLGGDSHSSLGGPPKLVLRGVFPPEYEGKVFTINESGAVIGSLESCDISLQDSLRSVSRGHAVIEWSHEESRFTIRDTDSSNGTTLTTDILSFRLVPNVIYPLHRGFTLQVGGTIRMLCFGSNAEMDKYVRRIAAAVEAQTKAQLQLNGSVAGGGEPARSVTRAQLKTRDSDDDDVGGGSSSGEGGDSTARRAGGRRTTSARTMADPVAFAVEENTLRSSDERSGSWSGEGDRM